MRRNDLEHVIRAASDISGEDEFVVVGSQAILASVPDPPEELLQSMEADLYPRAAPEKADMIEGSIGDGSAFERTFGYYAHGVSPETAKAPAGWEERLVRVVIAPRGSFRRTAVALCLEPHDLVLAKLARGAQRDWDYAQVAVRTGIVETDTLVARCATLPLAPPHRQTISRQLQALPCGRSS